VIKDSTIDHGVISLGHSITTLFASNPLAQSVGLLAFFIGISAFVQHHDRRLKVFLALYCAVIGLHFFLLGATTAAFSAWMSGIRSFISTRTRHWLVMLFFLLIVWIIGIPKIVEPIQWLTIVGTTVGTWALFREQGVKMRLMMWTGTVCWVTHNVVIGSIGGAMIEGTFLFVNGHTIYRLWRQYKDKAITTTLSQ
jgi:hypothetical protein